MTTTDTPDAPESRIHPALKGIGMLAPDEAIFRYYEAFNDLLESWSGTSPTITQAHMSMCDSFSILRHSLDPKAPLPQKHDATSAAFVIKNNAISTGLGL